MKYFYDRKADSLYLTLAERPYGDSVEAASGVVLDFDADGRLIGLDLERASAIIDVADLGLYEQPTKADVDAATLDGNDLQKQREALGYSQVEPGRKLSVNANTVARCPGRFFPLRRRHQQRPRPCVRRRSAWADSSHDACCKLRESSDEAIARIGRLGRRSCLHQRPVLQRRSISPACMRFAFSPRWRWWSGTSSSSRSITAIRMSPTIRLSMSWAESR